MAITGMALAATHIFAVAIHFSAGSVDVRGVEVGVGWRLNRKPGAP
jgi:hypothetical protein